VTAKDALLWWLGTVESVQPEEMDCDAVFELLEVVAEAVGAGEDIRDMFPAVAVHLDHCPGCRDLFDALVDLAKADSTRPSV
jgi:predicted anti-sigma-YlaC factor YlaD